MGTYDGGRQDTREDTDAGRGAGPRSGSLIKDIKLRDVHDAAHSHNGHLHARPMTTQNSSIDEDSQPLVLHVEARAIRWHDLTADDTMVNVSYADHRQGQLRVDHRQRPAVVEDVPPRSSSSGRKMAEAWFPGGVDRSRPGVGPGARSSHANYWDVKESKVVAALRDGQSRDSPESRPPQLGEHAESTDELTVRLWRHCSVSVLFDISVTPRTTAITSRCTLGEHRVMFQAARQPRHARAGDRS